MKNMSKTTKSSLITYGLVVLAYVVAEIFMKTGHMTSLLKGLLVPLCVDAILAVSLNLTVGILGELSLGEIIKNLVNVIYLGRDSAGFHFSMKDIMALNMEPDGEVIIKGAQGITGAPTDSNFTLGIILLLITLFIVLNLIHSRAGRAIMSIRDNRIAAESIGINITKYKILAFSISAALAGAAGVLYAHNLSTLTALPKNFGYNMSITVLVFVVLGGIGNIRGSIISAVVLTLLPELLRFLSDYRMLIYAVVLIVTMILVWSPGGIAFREKLGTLSIFKKKEKEVQ